ncbi:MAG: hypothetical protein PHD95_01135 [Candidatus ainarchaeum sp.]|nr:hypothetical protein [Candidatus ainarchaeum sp.]
MRKPRKAIHKVPRQVRRLVSGEQNLAEAHAEILTPLVLVKAKKLDPKKMSIFKIWAASKAVEWLPEGVPYKISSEKIVRNAGGLFVAGLNRPLILVADFLSPAERRNSARHELHEWEVHFARFPHVDLSHAHAVRRENPRLRRSTVIKVAEND